MRHSQGSDAHQANKLALELPLPKKLVNDECLQASLYGDQILLLGAGSCLVQKQGLAVHSRFGSNLLDQTVLRPQSQ